MPQIAIASCNSYQKQSVVERSWSCSIDTVAFRFKQFFRRAVSENLSGQAVDAVGKEADFIGGVIENTLSLGDEPTQHTVVAFVGTFLPGGVRMGEIHFQTAFLQQGEIPDVPRCLCRDFVLFLRTFSVLVLRLSFSGRSMFLMGSKPRST